MFRVPTFLEAPARFPFDDVEDRMNTRRGVPFQRVLAEHATRSAQRTLTVRPMAVLGWLAVCTVFGVFGDRPDLRANFVPVTVYLGLSLALWAAARLSPTTRKYSVLGLVLLDLPTIFLIQYQGVPLSPSPAGTAGFSVGILAVVLMVSVLTMRARNVIVIGVVSAVLQAILMARGGIDPGGVAAAFVVFGALATFGAYTTEQVWALMEGVSNEEIKVAEAARERLAMAAQIKEAEALGRLNADLRARSEDLSRTLEALRSAQADLIRAERMASVATLVKGIAHELNNPIGYIAGNMGPLRRYCDFLVRVATDLADGRPRSPAELAQLTQLSPRKDLKFVAEDLVRLTSDVDEGARRAKLIIGDLQSLTTSQRGVEQVDLARAVNQTLALLKPRTGPGVRVDTQLEPLPLVTARAGQLEQVLVNLVDNALRAVGPHGHVLVKLEAAETRFRLIVKDDGPGMTAEVKKQALEPFFTTRAPGEGSGMGLAIVAAIVSGHQGTVTLNSEPGAGTEIVIDLPLRPELPSREVAAVKRAGARDEDRF
ncbi:MAG: HAMP domain-containing sensor histidine kinase [Myxococcales bacterium]|nr:HAMP domain-containing sensor histidine kinase [Myxococcales bacterium]